jgi:hypothetical protein
MMMLAADAWALYYAFLGLVAAEIVIRSFDKS